MPIRGYVFIQPGGRTNVCSQSRSDSRRRRAEPVARRPALLPGVPPVARLDQEDAEPELGQRREEALGPGPGGVGHDEVERRRGAIRRQGLGNGPGEG